MKRHEPTKNLMQTLFGMKADKFTETGICRICGDEWQYSAPTEAELKRSIKAIGHLCPYCADADEDERKRMKKFAAGNRPHRSKGLLGFLFGTVFYVIFIVITGCAGMSAGQPENADYKQIISATAPNGEEINIGMSVEAVKAALGTPHKVRTYESPRERLLVYYLEGGGGYYFIVGLSIKAGKVAEIFSAEYERKINCAYFYRRKQ